MILIIAVISQTVNIPFTELFLNKTFFGVNVLFCSIL